MGGQHGAHLGPVGPRWAPRRPHEPCYLGVDCISVWRYIHSSRLILNSNMKIALCTHHSHGIFNGTDLHLLGFIMTDLMDLLHNTLRCISAKSDHDIEILPALLALSEGNPLISRFLTQMTSIQIFDDFFVVNLNNLLKKVEKAVNLVLCPGRPQILCLQWTNG